MNHKANEIWESTGLITNTTLRERVILAMEKYSDQQNKELREELEKWKATMTKHHDELIAENVKLIQQAGFANTIQEQMQIRIKQDIESLTRLRELLDRAKDLSERYEFLLRNEVGSANFEKMSVFTLGKQLLTEIDNALNHKP